MVRLWVQSKNCVEQPGRTLRATLRPGLYSEDNDFPHGLEAGVSVTVQPPRPLPAWMVLDFKLQSRRIEQSKVDALELGCPGSNPSHPLAV